MGDDPESLPSNDPQIPVAGSNIEKSPKKPQRKPLGPLEGLESSKAARQEAARLQKRLIEMMEAFAQAEANRHRRTTIDSIDYQAAFDSIAGPGKRQKAISLVADVAGAIGTGLIGYSINVYTGSDASKAHGHLAIIGGIALLILGIVLKYVVQWK